MGLYFIVKTKWVSCVLVSFIILSCSSKKGCIDPGSISYDPDARIDDGSCLYPTISLTPIEITEVNNYFHETSALKYTDNKLWTLIDASGERKIYSLNLVTGNEQENIDVPGISAVDFEALSSSPTHFFIGDIGNNEGSRQDLGIYKVPKPPTYNITNTASYEFIGYNYPEQTDLRDNENTNYDAESLIYHGDHLYIFTKNNEDRMTYLYRIPSIAGNYEAELRGVFDVKGVLTDADISPDGSKIVLTGHNPENGKVFIWVLKDFQGDKYFSGRKILVDIGSLSTVGQVEGVTFYNNDFLFISNEKNSDVDASLYYLDISTIQ